MSAPYLAVAGSTVSLGALAATSRRAAAVNAEARGAGPVRAATDADLVGSSKYSKEILEGRSGEGFRVISACSRVSRSYEMGERHSEGAG